MDRIHEKTTSKLGRPNELSEVEEDLLAERIKLMGGLGLPAEHGGREEAGAGLPQQFR